MKIDLRKEAKGRECQIKIIGVCNKNPETSSLCHLNNQRMFGIGMSQKAPDMFGAHGCSNCHAVVDGRQATDLYSREEILALHYEGVFRTQDLLRKEGKL